MVESDMSTRIRVSTAAAATLVALASPLVAAQAASVRATTGGSGPYGVAEGSVIFTASPGESNRLTVRLVSGSHGLVEVRDDGAVVQPGDRCTAAGPGLVRCDASADFVDVTVDAGDGDDQVTVEDPLYGILQGGSGNDTLVGGCQITGDDGNDTLVGCLNTLPALGHRLLGGRGDDSIEGSNASEVIDGGGGRDVLLGGGGNDDLGDGDSEAGDIGADLIDGGAGSDTVSYSARRADLTIDLARADGPQGAVGEGDTLRNVENVIAGRGNDVLLGSDAANRLDGGAGADRIDGRSGNDQLLGGADSDNVQGGPGADLVVTRDLYRDIVSCGAGRDEVLRDPGDAVIGGCEATVKQPLRLAAFNRLGVADRRASVRLRCDEVDELPRIVTREFERCGFKLTLRMRINGKLRNAATTTCGARGCRPFVLRSAAWRRLRAHRSATAYVDFLRLPSQQSLRHVEKVTLKIKRLAAQ
jgi:hypothetical protein